MRPLLIRATLLFLVVLGVQAAPAAALPECGCPAVGDYVAPASTTPKINSDGTSPGGRYVVSASGSSQINLTVRRVSTNAVVYSSTLPGSSAWGFSPDQDRFVYHYVTGSVHNYVLIDLTRTTGQQVASGAVAMWSGAPGGTARLVFSPRGKYLMHAVRTGATAVSMRVVNATTGAARHDNTLIISATPGSRGDSYGMANWGFSPDAEDRTLTYGYVNGSNSVSWNVVNLQSGQYVHSHDVLAISAFWMFSPCGDAIGIVEQNSPNFLDVSLYRTATTGTLGSQSGLTLGSATLSSTLAQHQVTINGTAHRLADNTADDACAAATALDSLTVAPAAVVGGAGNATGTVRLNRVPSGSFTVNLSSSDTSAATVPATLALTTQQRTFTVTSRAVSAPRTVTITAQAGGVTKTVTLTVNPPAPAAPTVSDLSFSPASVQGGDAATGTVTLSAAAPAGGTTVGLQSLDSAATVPPSVTLTAGRTTATFAVATAPVSTATQAPIRATLGSSSLTRELEVTASPSGAGGAVLRDGNCLANVLPANDDGSSALQAMPFTLSFFGTEYDSLYVNNNGNVTFDTPLSAYTPFDLTSTNRVIVAPFFADVDTRGAGSGLVTWGSTVVDGHTTFCVNWTGTDWDGVGYYNARTNRKNSFQLLLIDRADTGAGNFDLEFRYDKVQWETGDFSGGSGGLGGSSARAGYSNGDSANSLELSGSAVNGAFLDTSPTGLTRNSRNAQENGRYVFAVRNGVPPTGGRISGATLAPDGSRQPGVQVQACRTDGGAESCVNGRSNTLGNYTLAGLPDGDYTLTAFPPAFSGLSRGTRGPVTVAGADVHTGQDISLVGPVGPPPGTTISPSTTNGQGIPSVYWRDPLTLSTEACPGGTATYEILSGTTVVAGGDLEEGPAGTYSATIAPLAPATGLATVRIAIDCPDPEPDQAIEFNIYIDPSGNVRTVEGDPIAGATVTLLRSSSASGPFAEVPNGSDIMDPSNRANPDTTDDAGHFGWDVIAGYYRVRAEKEGCVSPDDPSQTHVESRVMEIPPPVTDLDLRLDCPRDEEPSGDETAPQTAATVSPAANAAGWHRDDVTVRLRASDEGEGASGVARVTFRATGAQPIATTEVAGDEATIPITAGGMTTVEFFATDAAGNAEEPRSVVVRIDRAAPLIGCAAPDGAWHAANVSLACTAADTRSGLADEGDAAFSLSTSVPAGTETADAATGSRRVCDVAGNCATAGPIAGNRVDRRAPSISVPSPADGATFTLRQIVAAGYGCADGGSGVASCSGPVADGARIDTATVGAKTFAVAARDAVGNTASSSHAYRVIYDFAGFFAPVADPPAVNVVQGGRTIPLKFSLHGDHGLGVLAPGAPFSERIACDGSAPSSAAPATSTSAAGLTYDAREDQYHYGWKTEKAWNGTCRRLTLELADGTVHRAMFSFKP